MTDPADDRDHSFSEGEGFDDPYDEFDLDPPELGVDPSKVDPVDSRVVTDTLDEHTIDHEDVDANELIDVGLNYMQINRYEQATEAFERAASFADDDRVEQEAWVNKGVAHAELEEYDEAIGAHREALRIDDSSEHAATAETNLAYALWEFGETAQALEHAERAVEIDERFAEGWFNRAFFLSERGLAEEALHCIDNAIRLGLRNAKVLEEKAEILEELGEYDEAEEIAEEANEMLEQAEQRIMEDRMDGRGQAGGAGAGGAGGAGGPGGQAPFGEAGEEPLDDLADPGRRTGEKRTERDREFELE
ncbi:Tetratricopeptide repeat-containing protein [Halobiforma haloterrestris]|uniref:Tetratricopeptide repeat-containing protein n=1 Tax=Natronobacterium haloterrestre TaxID=148448 RepID=A0A1I1H979_NATHA|nr:tetratricopeptide repeat protein [Halobiforma haloterrestris]SFC18578.1 Tetratricopeptide repeat-containing protein [Halobiforma haloterrestris]